MSPFQPLDGVRVLDLTRLLPGPYGTHLLAELGADVVKIESPDEGDYLRYHEQPDTDPDTVSPYFRLLNSNKQSVTLDLKSEEGTELFYRLVESADVVVESFRPGVVDRLDVDYDTLTEYNPDLVYCSLSGFGQESPYLEVSGHDINYLALSGILGLTGTPDGGPVVPGTTVADLSSGTFVCLSVLAALFDGESQYIDVSMTDVVTTWTLPYIHHQFSGGDVPGRGQTRHQKYPSYTVYETSDGGYLALGAAEPKFWRNFCTALGLEQYVDDHQSDDPATRQRVRAAVQDVVVEKTREEWLEFFAEYDVPISPVNELGEVVEDEHVQERGLVVEDEDGNRRFRFPVQFGDSLEHSTSTPPTLGEDTEAILTELGVTADEIASLRQDDILS